MTIHHRIEALQIEQLLDKFHGEHDILSADRSNVASEKNDKDLDKFKVMLEYRSCI